MMSLALTLLGATAAFGVTYINLKGARYRTKLLARFQHSIEGKGDRNAEQPMSAEPGYGSLLASDHDFSTAHSDVSKWIGELPAAVATRLATQVDKPKTLPALYRWFRISGDKYAVGLLATGSPMAAMWALVLWPSAPLWPLFVIAGLGQAVVAGHVAAGSWLVWRYGSEFNSALESIRVKLESQGVGQSLRSALDHSSSKATR